VIGLGLGHGLGPALGGTLGLLGASGSSSTGLMMATWRPSLSRKKYVPPRPASAAAGGCAARARGWREQTRHLPP